MDVQSVCGRHRSESVCVSEVKRDDQRLPSSPRRARPLFYSLFITYFILFDQRLSRISRAMRVCRVQSLKTRRHLNSRSLRPGTVPVLGQTKEPSVGDRPAKIWLGGLAVVVFSISISTWIWVFCESVNKVSNRTDVSRSNKASTVRETRNNEEQSEGISDEASSTNGLFFTVGRSRHIFRLKSEQRHSELLGTNV